MNRLEGPKTRRVNKLSDSLAPIRHNHHGQRGLLVNTHKEELLNFMVLPSEIEILSLVYFVSSLKHVMHPLLNAVLLKIALIRALSKVKHGHDWAMAKNDYAIHRFEVSKQLN
jgi:hypothetical protein